MHGKLVYCLAVAVGLTGGLAAPAGAVPRVYTIAGAGTYGYSGDGGPATSARIAPECVAGMPDGSVLLAGEWRVRRIGRDGRITTVAGTGVEGFSGDGGPARRARIEGCDVAALPHGGFLLADRGSNRLRRVSPAGRIMTVAGTGDPGWSGDGGPALRARLGEPQQIAVRGDGSVLVLTNAPQPVLRRIDAKGRISTLAGVANACDAAQGQGATDIPLTGPGALAPTPDGGFALADSFGCVLGVSADGRIDVLAHGFEPVALSQAADGSLLAASSDRIRRLDRDRTATVVAGCDGNACIRGDGPARSVRLSDVQAVAAEPDGGFLLADPERVAHIDAAGTLTTIARVGGVSLAREADGHVLLAHRSASGSAPEDTVLRIAPDGVSVAAGGGTETPRAGVHATAARLDPVAVQALPDGFAVLDAGGPAQVVLVSSAGMITRVIPISSKDVYDFALLADGTILVSRRDTATVRQRLANGAWKTVAGGSPTPLTGMRASSAAIPTGASFAPLGGGRVLIGTGRTQLWIGRNGLIERVTHRWMGTAWFAPGPRGTALFSTGARLRRIAADGSVTTLAGGGWGGFFGSTDGQSPSGVDLYRSRIAALAAMRDGGLLIAQSGELLDESARLRWIAPDHTGRLGVAITRHSLHLLRSGLIAIRTTTRARLLIEVRRRSRILGREHLRVQAGETAVPLPPRLPGGRIVTITVRASTRNGQRAWTQHRLLLGSYLPLFLARRYTLGPSEFEGGHVSCRRLTARRATCLDVGIAAGGTEAYPWCTATTVFLQANGVIYQDEYEDLVPCTHRDELRLRQELPPRRGGSEAPPL